MELLIKTCRVTAWLIWVIALKVIYNIEIHIGGQIVAGDVGVNTWIRSALMSATDHLDLSLVYNSCPNDKRIQIIPIKFSLKAGPSDLTLH